MRRMSEEEDGQWCRVLHSNQGQLKSDLDLGTRHALEIFSRAVSIVWWMIGNLEVKYGENTGIYRRIFYKEHNCEEK